MNETIVLNMSDLIINGRFNMTGYPSGYETWEVVFISVIVVFIMATIIIGNLLVIVAIFSEYTLQCVQNWFVASLAVADLMLGIIVMPFSLSQEVVGYWLFGAFWCQVRTLFFKNKVSQGFCCVFSRDSNFVKKMRKMQ